MYDLEDAVRCRLSVDFGTEASFTTVEAPVGIAGAHSVDVVHLISDDTPCEIRIFLMRAAFHGELRVRGASLKRES
jgi:hypothetical protein